MHSVFRVPSTISGGLRGAQGIVWGPQSRGWSFISAHQSWVRLLPAPQQSLLPCLDAPTCRLRTLRLTRAYFQLRVSLASLLLPARSLCPALSGVTPFGSVQGGLCEVSGEGESPPLPLQSCRLSPPSCVSLGVKKAALLFAFVTSHLGTTVEGLANPKLCSKQTPGPALSRISPSVISIGCACGSGGEPRWVAFLSYGSGMFHLEQRQLLPAIC